MSITTLSEMNPQQPIPNHAPANLARLESVFQQGICSPLSLRNRSQNHQPGYDNIQQDVVYLNGVNKAENIFKTVFDPADGIYTIATEYENDQEFLKSLSNPKRVDELFSEIMRQIPSQCRELYAEKFREIAFKDAIKENPDVLNILSERSHKVAVLILDNVRLSAAEIAALAIADGFYFFQRKIIEPQKIKIVLMSEKLESAPEMAEIKQNYPNVGFEFVPSCTHSKVPFSYKATSGNSRYIQSLEVSINAPDFLPKLTEIFNDHSRV